MDKINLKFVTGLYYGPKRTKYLYVFQEKNTKKFYGIDSDKLPAGRERNSFLKKDYCYQVEFSQMINLERTDGYSTIKMLIPTLHDFEFVKIIGRGTQMDANYVRVIAKQEFIDNNG